MAIKDQRILIRISFSQRVGATVLLLFLLLLLSRTVFTPQKQQLYQPDAKVTSNQLDTKVTSNFITRSGNDLFLKGQKFRFAGANIPWLGFFGGGANGPYYPTFAQIDAGFVAANAMHATVVRGMNLGVSVGCAICIEPSLNTFNDQAFKTIDYAIKTATHYHMHLLIPLVDNYHYAHGGKHIFTDWRGLSDEDLFYTNPTVMQDFKNYIAHILNHVNQYTKVALKDDPTIMAWETGNELDTAPDTWTETIAEYIKSIAPNQLVADGKQANYIRDLTSEQLQLPSVDLYTSHFYFSTDDDYISRAQISANLAKQYIKVYYIGEYDWTTQSGTPTDLARFLSTIEDPVYNIAGDTYWQLYPQGAHGDQYTLHYPGDTSNMQQRVQILANHASKNR
jgi:mannan endo-1,4-beta-mannosidase